MNLKIPFSKDVQEWVWEATRKKLHADQIAIVLVIAELTESEPDAVRQRLAALTAECKRVIYNL